MTPPSLSPSLLRLLLGLAPAVLAFAVLPSSSYDNDDSPLDRARQLKVPIASGTERAEFEGASFWDGVGPLLREAWEEYERCEVGNDGDTFRDDTSCSVVEEEEVSLLDGLMEPSLALALREARASPSREAEYSVRSHWKSDVNDTVPSLTGRNQTDSTTSATTPLPRGVYATNLLTTEGISQIRSHLDAASASGIPTRRPNGMNRRGLILDSEVDGAVPLRSLTSFVDALVDEVVRPSGRMLFPDRVGCGDDVEYYAFTIRYGGNDDDGEDDDDERGEKDVELKEHRDASVVTINVNLNLPEEGYGGSQVYFGEYPGEEDGEDWSPSSQSAVEPKNDHSEAGGTVRFSPGMAILHLGAHRHGSLPILDDGGGKRSGKRYNLVIWLFGKQGDVRIAPYPEAAQMSVVERWRGCN